MFQPSQLSAGLAVPCLCKEAAKKHKPQTSKVRKKKQSPYSSSSGSSRSRPQDRSTGNFSKDAERAAADAMAGSSLADLLLAPLRGFRAMWEVFEDRFSDLRVPDFKEEFEQAIATSG